MLETLESLSGYRHAFDLNDPNLANNPVNYSHLILTVGGKKYHVLSRICDAGIDYTQRTNKLAHHVVLTDAELNAGGPAWALSQPGFCVTKWEGDPRTIPQGRTIDPRDKPPQVCRAWQAATGDAGWGGVLAESFLEQPPRTVSVIFKPGQDLLPLVVESLALVPEDRRWDVTFSTYFTRLPAGVECHWRFLLDGSPEAKAVRANPHLKVVDLTARLGRAADGKLVDSARTGVPVATVKPTAPSHTTVSHSPSPNSASQTASQELDRDSQQADEPNDAGSISLLAEPSAVRARQAPPQVPPQMPATSRPARRRKPKRGPLVPVLTTIAVLFAIGVGASGVWLYKSLDQRKAAGPQKSEETIAKSDTPNTTSSDTGLKSGGTNQNRLPNEPTAPPGTTNSSNQPNGPSAGGNGAASAHPNTPAATNPLEPKSPSNSPIPPKASPTAVVKVADLPARTDVRGATTPGSIAPPAEHGKNETPDTKARPVSSPPNSTVDPPKKVVPKRNPFEDIVKRDKRLVLPAPQIGNKAGPTSAFKPIAALNLTNPADCTLRILGADVVFAEQSRIKVARSVSQPSVCEWQVTFHPPNEYLNPKSLLGTFQITKESLNFRWEGSGDLSTSHGDRLKYCVLELSSSADNQIVRSTLVAPQPCDLITPHFVKNQPQHCQLSTTWNSADQSLDKHLRLFCALRNLPAPPDFRGVTLRGPQVLSLQVGHPPQAFILDRPSEKDHDFFRLALKLELKDGVPYLTLEPTASVPRIDKQGELDSRWEPWSNSQFEQLQHQRQVFDRGWRKQYAIEKKQLDAKRKSADTVLLPTLRQEAKEAEAGQRHNKWISEYTAKWHQDMRYLIDAIEGGKCPAISCRLGIVIEDPTDHTTVDVVLLQSSDWNRDNKN
jgi:hypothetical protein